MSKTTAQKSNVIVQPDVRGGGWTAVITQEKRRTSATTRKNAPRDSYMAKVLSNLRQDQNLIYLAARLQNYSEVCESRMASLKLAISNKDCTAVVDIAHGLTDCTSKIGAIKMMKLCIALQMLGRRGLIDKANSLALELETEYERFKESLISAVG